MCEHIIDGGSMDIGCRKEGVTHHHRWQTQPLRIHLGILRHTREAGQSRCVLVGSLAA